MDLSYKSERQIREGMWSASVNTSAASSRYSYLLRPRSTAGIKLPKGDEDSDYVAVYTKSSR